MWYSAYYCHGLSSLTGEQTGPAGKVIEYQSMNNKETKWHPLLPSYFSVLLHHGCSFSSFLPFSWNLFFIFLVYLSVSFLSKLHFPVLELQCVAPSFVCLFSILVFMCVIPSFNFSRCISLVFFFLTRNCDFNIPCICESLWVKKKKSPGRYKHLFLLKKKRNILWNLVDFSHCIRV